ncbi:MAG: alanine racemase [Firmicutes bacterium]|nr:alanine racemase [Bacillota bacterium]MBQ6662277.1 alanine racemase [Bacillota bacterium]
MEKNRILRDTKIVIDLARISQNVRLIKDMVGPDVALMAVVKANAYGLGIVPMAPVILKSGADYLAVATLTEAVQIKEAYPDFPVFILGHTPDRMLDVVAELDIAQTIFSLHQAELLSQEALKRGRRAKIHIKVDTGFHRLGKVPTDEFAAEIKAMFALPGIEVEGIFSHLALASEEDDIKQYEVFTTFLAKLKEMGCHFKYEHIADSIACVDYPGFRMNMVRPGALIYGMRGFHVGFLPVEPAITFQSAISQLHAVKTGEGVGYDFLWRAERDSLVATLPFGYADGYPRQMRDKGYVVINGVKAPLIGVLCMDQVMADVTDVPNVQEGDVAIIYGDGTDGAMTFQEAADLLGTNKNDVLCRLTTRPPREYVNNPF